MKAMKVRFLFILSFLVLAPLQFVEAYEPIMLGEIDQHDTVGLEDPRIKSAYFGELQNSPHTYEIVSEDPFTLSAQILVPDTEEAKKELSIIVIESRADRTVGVVGRMKAKDVAWEQSDEKLGGEMYRSGPKVEADVEAGTYRVEVSTPNNIGKYVLLVGTEDGKGSGYFRSIRDTARIKVFFGKSQFAVIGSPLVYVPLGVLLIIFIGLAVVVRLNRIQGGRHMQHVEEVSQ